MGPESGSIGLIQEELGRKSHNSTETAKNHREADEMAKYFLKV